MSSQTLPLKEKSLLSYLKHLVATSKGELQIIVHCFSEKYFVGVQGKESPEETDLLPQTQIF